MKHFKTAVLQFALGILAYGVMIMAVGQVSFAAFPIGGAEYHAIFAYTSEGRLRPAVLAYGVYVATLSATAWALIRLRFPLRWWLTVALATGVCLRMWWGIVSWEPQSATFHRTALGLWVIIPILVFVASLSALPPGNLDSRPTRQPRTVARLTFGIALGFLTLPYVSTAAGLLTPWIAEIKRQRWIDPAWQSTPSGLSYEELDPTKGVLFAGDNAKLLLKQCRRPTPALVTGTWTPSAGDIVQLEVDLAPFLAGNDTGRTRSSGFVMPPFSAYYRQYGGITVRRRDRLIYINAGLPGFSTDSIVIDGRLSWQVRAISVCGGWQAYFGLEYDPDRRMFRAFGYNP